MTILFIRSLYKGIYTFLEDWLIQEFKQCGIQLQIVSTMESLSIAELREITTAFTFLGNNLSSEDKSLLKENQIQLIVWLTEDPFQIDKSMQIIDFCDIALTIDHGSYEYYKSKGYKNVYFLPLGTNQIIFQPQSVTNDYYSDLLLIGYPYPNRVKLILYLAERIDCKITVIGKGWHNSIPKRFRKRPQLEIINRWIPPKEVVKYYNGTKIVLNSHRTHDFQLNKNSLCIANNSLNNRTFDIAASQAFQITDKRLGSFPHFSNDELISYNNEQDLLTKVSTFLKDKQSREAIAKNSRNKVLHEHLLFHRVKKIIEIVNYK